ncbi:hypothetical protein PLESTB_000525400 [Pleodorina starrii]|uniref:Uncharacterized protein n=1 Tax=Pleodorina starrii TaxID=330485 RepID=A0A9W6BHE7_9CHLO|nr:hypothetical protein PLESTM_000388800 [Pleodorina starrii]GLC51652.1 hypothetical protein PLESTB_000525400 [Pleodorina starrii]GLC72420.1 hypothetical protein PLESTF_001245700 [Pleodorina starrii]
MVVQGACIIKEGVGLPADVEELGNLGFKLRTAGSLVPDVLVTVMGRPHAFLLLDPLKFDTEAAGVSARLVNVQHAFRNVYLLMPGSYGQAATASLAARYPDVTAVTFNDVQDAVGAAARLVAALCEGTDEGCLGLADTQSQRLAVAVDAAAVDTTVQAAEALENSSGVEPEVQPAASSV